MFYKLVLFVALVALPARAEDFDAAFVELGDLPEATVPGFDYKLSLKSMPSRGAIVRGRINGVLTAAIFLQFRAESLERIPGDGPMKFVSGKTTVGNGAIDFAAIRESTLDGEPDYPPDKPAAMFRFELRRLLLINGEVRLRLRFKDATHHYVLRYADGKGLRLAALDASDRVQADAASLEDFKVISESKAGITWHSNAITTWASDGEKLLWSTDVQMEGQPKSMKIVDDLLLVTTTAGHSFYIVKDTGEAVIYDKSEMAGNDPMAEILQLARRNMEINDKRRSLARFIYASVILDDRRSIPFLIDCVERGDGIPVRLMAVAALEKFNGNPDLWTAKDSVPGRIHFQWVPMSRVFPQENCDAEMAKWRKVFAAELHK